MGNNEINNENQWSAFVGKLLNDTENDRIAWRVLEGRQLRERAIGPFFLAEIVEGKFVAVFRYQIDYSFEDDRDSWEEIAVEIVKEDGEKLWRLPSVGPRYALIDLLEFRNADAQEALSAFLHEN